MNIRSLCVAALCCEVSAAALMLSACGSVSDTVDAGVGAAVETAFAPLDVLVGLQPYAGSRAMAQARSAANQMTQWNQVKESGDYHRVLGFVSDESKFRIAWAPTDTLPPEPQAKVMQVRALYGRFQNEIENAILFKSTYDRAISTKSDPDIVGLIRVAKPNPLFAGALDDPQLSGHVESAAYNQASAANSAERLAEFISWFPNGSDTARAATQLGNIYAQGIGGPVNHEKAVAFYQQAVSAGSTEAAALLQSEQQVLAAEQREREAEAERKAAEVAAQEAQQATWTKLLDQIVTADSHTWIFNRYVAGSVRNVSMTAGSAGAKQVVLKGDYSFSSSQSGWVEAHFDNSKLKCVVYWDFPDDCRPVGSPNELIRALAAASVRPAPSHARSRTSQPAQSGDGGFGAMLGAAFAGSSNADRERQMEEINNERDQPLSRDDSTYEEMNDPNSPQPDFTPEPEPSFGGDNE